MNKTSLEYVEISVRACACVGGRVGVDRTEITRILNLHVSLGGNAGFDVCMRLGEKKNRRALIKRQRVAEQV